MRSLKSLAFLALLVSFSLTTFADTSKDAKHAKDEVTNAIEPHQRRPSYCRYGCCGSFAYGQCSACCSRFQAGEAEAETNNVVVEPQQRYTGGCRNGCCGGSSFGRCKCCPQSQTMKTLEANTAGPQQIGRSGCRYGCCGSFAFGGCSACCSRPQEETEVVEPQQRGGCRYGCCGSYAYGQCSACCSKKIATEQEKTKEEAKP